MAYCRSRFHNLYKNIMKRATILFCSLIFSSSSMAGGYRVAIQGQKALGMAHAATAMSDSSETVFFNPAGMTQLKNDLEMNLGISLIDSKIAYQNSNTLTQAETDNPLGTPINAYIAKKASDKLSYGLGIYTPYGNTVKWDDDWAGSHLVNNITFKALYLQPTIAYQFSDSMSIGFGPTYVIGEVELNKNLSSALSDSNGNRSNVTISQSNISEWGYNLGLMAQASEDITIGVTFHSEIKMKARGGSAKFANIPTSLQTVYKDTTFDADLPLPAELNIGVAYKTSPQTTWAFEINRAYWSAYKELKVSFDSTLIADSVNARNYSDANIFRVGLQHRLNNDLTLRAGIYKDESPVGTGYFAPETPRNDSLGYTAGASYKMSKNLDLDFSFLLLTFKEIDGSYDHIIESDGSTSSFGGTYKSSVVSIGFGINYIF